jgi:hypothetical protein
MSWQAGSNAVIELRDQWHRWTKVVHVFAKRGRARHRIDERNYAPIYNELLEACRFLAEMVEGEEKAYFQNLEHIVLPWWAPKSFQLADRAILADLLTHCREVERELGGRVWTMPNVRKPLRLVFMFIALIGGLFLLDSAGRAWLPMLEQGRSWQDAIHVCIERSRYLHSLLIPSLVVVAVSSYVVQRTARH